MFALAWWYAHDSFVCATWLIHMCDVNHSYVRHDSFTCATWLVHTCDTMHMCDTTPSSAFACWYACVCVCVFVTHALHRGGVIYGLLFLFVQKIKTTTASHKQRHYAAHTQTSFHTHDWIVSQTVCRTHLYQTSPLLQHNVTHCNSLQLTAPCCHAHILQVSPLCGLISSGSDCGGVSAISHCNMIQHTATHRDTLQYTAKHYTRYNTL